MLSGTDDNLMPMANSAVLAAYLPNARLHVVERWGHYLLHDPASGAAATIADFLGAADHCRSDGVARNARRSGARTWPSSCKRRAAAARTRGPVTNGVVRRLYPLQNGAR